MSFRVVGWVVNGKARALKTIFFALLGLLVFCADVAYAVDPVPHEIKIPDPQIRAASPKGTPPPGPEIVNPAEFSPADGVILTWSGWDQTLIADIAEAVAKDDKVFLIVANPTAQSQAYSFLNAAGVNMSNVEFITNGGINGSSMWIRDFGPFCIQDSGQSAIVDYVYGSYDGNDSMPFALASNWGLPCYDSDLIHHGGNHIVDGNRMGFVSTNIYTLNPAYSPSEVRSDLSAYLGVDSLVVVEPMAGDATGHIDMFCKLLNDTLFVVGEYARPEDAYGDDFHLLNSIAATLDNLHNLDGREFEVARIPMPPFSYSGPAGTINYTYTNSLIINDKILVPVYGFESDAEALQIYADLMPGYEVVGIDSAFIIGYWGAVHCVTSLRHRDNPLLVFHEPVTEMPPAGGPVIQFRINPAMENTQATVWYKPVSAQEFLPCQATLKSGIWSARLPEMVEGFSYYIAGRAFSGATEYPVQSPSGAPGNVYVVDLPTLSNAPELWGAEGGLSVQPNPFNPITEISFQLDKAQQVDLVIYGLDGHRVAPLVSDYFPEGRHQVRWDGRDDRGRAVASGTYICLLRGDTVRYTARLVLVR